MLLLACFLEIEISAPRDHFPTEQHELVQHLFQIQHLRLTAHHSQHDDPERLLHLGIFIKGVQHHLRVGALLELDHHADAIAVRFIPKITDTLKSFVAVHLGNLFHQPGFVDLKRQFPHDDKFPIAFRAGFHFHPGPHFDLSSAPVVRGAQPRRSVHQTARGKIRTGYQFNEIVNHTVRMVDQMDRGADDFPKIVRRNVGRHAHGNTG